MSTDPYAGATDARDRLEQLRRDAHRAADEAARLAAHIEQSTYAAWSPGREVRVTVGPDALIQRVEFTAGAPRSGPRSLAAATLDAHRRALTLLRASVEDAVADAPASVGDLAGAVADAARTMLPSDEPRYDGGR